MERNSIEIDKLHDIITCVLERVFVEYEMIKGLSIEYGFNINKKQLCDFISMELDELPLYIRLLKIEFKKYNIKCVDDNDALLFEFNKNSIDLLEKDGVTFSYDE